MNKVGEIDLLKLEEDVISNADKRDVQFLSKFVQTQMFVSYIEE